MDEVMTASGETGGRRRRAVGAARTMVAIAAAVFLTACATAPVFLQHPTTGTRVQCGPYRMAGQHGPRAAVDLERGCIADYQRQGYERVPAGGGR